MNKKQDNKNNKDSGVCITYVGGQALMEGIMMRSKNGYAQVVRNPKGQMVLSREPIAPAAKKSSFFNWPVVRGSVRLIDSLSLGMKALSSSAEIAGIEDETEEEKKKRLEKEAKRNAKKKNKDAGSVDSKEKKDSKEGFGLMMGVSLVLSLALSVLLFMLLPNFVTDLVLPDDVPTVVYNLVESLLRIGIFLLYMFLVSRLKDIKRVFMYHGAEHKTIHCFEHGDPLTVENVRKYSKHHPRCGTAFMFVVMIVSIIIYSFVPRFDVLFDMKMLKLLNVLLRIVLLPLIAGIAYEFNRFAGKSNGWVAKVLRAPGMGMQRFTTFEPDDSMIECAILALKEALKLDDVPNYSFAEKLKMAPTVVDKDGNVLPDPVPETEEQAPETEEKLSDSEIDISADGCEDPEKE